MRSHRGTSVEDPFHLVTRLGRKLKTSWLRWTYPFVAFGRDVTIHFSSDIPRPMTSEMSIGDNVFIAPEAWLTVIPSASSNFHPRLILGNRVSVGKRTSISAHNQVLIGDSVLIGPSVVIMDYNHEFSDPTLPIMDQGVTEGGQVVIECNSWIGQGAAILAGREKLVVGRNSIIGANAVVTRSCPPYSVMVGNPARLVRSYDLQTRTWIRASNSQSTEGVPEIDRSESRIGT